jgi:hypothetical protein
VAGRGSVHSSNVRGEDKKAWSSVLITVLFFEGLYHLCDGNYCEREWACTHPPPTPPAWADFSIMMEFTPEIDSCHSVCTLWVDIEGLGEGGGGSVEWVEG